ncbi:MAG TPA: 3-oxoacyl-[acyl-carrier-protein] synthase III C-terminal domain-containing protein [Acidobacteriota bacterium]|nr:3-oxoacyl-[acyl-carrier-protein] synthase III C-terminal domain-containing protein [Acidobacteriota bacterium]
MPVIQAIATAVPPHVLAQEDIRDAALHHFSRGRRDMRRLIPIFDNVNVKTRHLCVPLQWYDSRHSFTDTNGEYIRWARKLGRQAAQECLQRAGRSPGDVDHLIFVSTSGLSTPSIDAHLINEMGFDAHVRRTPVFGLGCAGGAAGLSRLLDLSRVPGQGCVLLVSVELCSLTFQFHDFSKANLVASSLFSDGAAAVLVCSGSQANGARCPRIVASHSTLWPDTMDVMGWDFSEHGLGVIFSRRIPTLIGDRIRDNIAQFLERQGLGLSDLSHFLVHPGGAKILQVLAEVLELKEEQLAHSRWVLENYGNMSSPTLLFILERFQRLSNPRKGDYGLAAAFGPGFSSELILLQW